MIPGLLTMAALVAPARALPLQVEVHERGSGALVSGAWITVEGRRVEAPDGTATLDLPAGSHLLEVASPVHAPVEIGVELPRDQVLRLYLRADLAPMEVVVEARRLSPHVSRQVLDRERIDKTPGAFDDPIRLIQSLPGVAVTREFSPQVGQVALRGAPTEQSRFYVDGVELPYLYHFDQYASVVPSRALDEVAVYPSAFGPAYGDAVGGVVAARTRAPETDRAHGSVDLNLIMAGAQASTPVGDHLAISASARRSYLDLVSGSDDQYTVWPVFYDFTGRVDWKPTVDHSLSLMTLGGGDSYSRYAGDTASLDPLQADAESVFHSDRDFQVVLLQAQDQTGSAVLHTVVSVVNDRFGGTVAGAAAERRAVQRLALRHESDVVLGPHTLALGGDGQLERVGLQVQTDRPWPELEGEAPLLVQGVAMHQAPSRWAGGLWAEPRLALGPATVQTGLRLQGDSSVQAGPALDPRLTVQVALPHDLRLRGAAGLYSQAPPLDDPVPGTAARPWTRALDGVLGADLALAGRLELAVEGWARRGWTGASLAEAGLAPAADGPVFSAEGVELTSRYRLRERFFTWASLSLGRAREDGQVTAWDQPLALNLVGSWTFRPGWNAGLRWRYASGTPYTPITGADYDGNADQYLGIPGAAWSARMPPYQKVDLHLQRDWSLRVGQISLYVELWWVPPGANRLYPVYSYDYSQTAFVVGPSLVPLIGMRATF